MRQVKQAEITGEDIYNKFIKTGGFVFFPEVIRHLENFIQKSDGSFRNAALIIPILYLVLQAIGKETSMDPYASVWRDRACSLERCQHPRL